MLQIRSNLKIGRTNLAFLFGDSGANHASVHAARPAGNIVTDLVLDRFALPLLANVADLLYYHRGALLLRILVVRCGANCLHPQLEAAKAGTVLRQIEHLVVVSDVGVKVGNSAWQASSQAAPWSASPRPGR